MVVVHLLDGKELIGVGHHGAQPLVVVEIVAAANAGEPELHALLHHRQQLIACAQVTLLLGHRRQLGQARQALALPVGAGAPVVAVFLVGHQGAALAHVGLQQVGQLLGARALAHAGPVGQETRIAALDLELGSGQQPDLAAHAVVGRAQLACHRGVVVPLVRVQAEQRAMVGAFHDAGLDLEHRLDLALRLVETPFGPRVLDEGVGVAGQQLQRGRLGVGQGGDGEIALAGRQPAQPFGVGNSLPSHAGGAEGRKTLRAHLQHQRARVGTAFDARAGGGQLQPHVAAADPQAGVRAAMGHGDAHVVAAAGHGDVDGPVAGARQLGGAGFERRRRDDDGVLVRIVDLHVAPLGGDHFLGRQRHFEAGRRGADGQRVGIDGFGLGVEEQRGVPLVGLRRRLEHVLGAHGRLRRSGFAALGRQEISARARLRRLCQGAGPGERRGQQEQDHALDTVHLVRSRNCSKADLSESAFSAQSGGLPAVRAHGDRATAGKHPCARVD